MSTITFLVPPTIATGWNALPPERREEIARMIVTAWLQPLFAPVEPYHTPAPPSPGAYARRMLQTLMAQLTDEDAIGLWQVISSWLRTPGEEPPHGRR